jgi:methionyl-tRNA formyltransferase
MLKIIEAVPVDVASRAGIGQVIRLPGPEVTLGIGTGKGILGVIKLQLEGKRVMNADEFIRGQRGFIGAVLPS